jgi:hypothetical protein
MVRIILAFRLVLSEHYSIFHTCFTSGQTIYTSIGSVEDLLSGKNWNYIQSKFYIYIRLLWPNPSSHGVPPISTLLLGSNVSSLLPHNSLLTFF